MRYRSMELLALVLGVSIATAGRADIGPSQVPDDPAGPQGPAVYSLTVKVDPQARQAKLQIPDTLAAPAPAPGAAPSAPAAPSADDQSSFAPNRTRTMVAGLTMSLALASLVLVRRSSRSKQIVAGMVVAAVSLGAIGMAWGDIPGPGPRPRPPIRPNPDAQIQVEVVSGADGVTLIVPEGMLGRLEKAGAVTNLPRERRGVR
jgi:hypothetical protein